MEGKDEESFSGMAEGMQTILTRQSRVEISPSDESSLWEMVMGFRRWLGWPSEGSSFSQVHDKQGQIGGLGGEHVFSWVMTL